MTTRLRSCYVSEPNEVAFLISDQVRISVAYDVHSRLSFLPDLFIVGRLLLKTAITITIFADFINCCHQKQTSSSR